MIGIYKIENKNTHQIYIGQSIHIEERFREHILCATNQTKKTKMYKALGADLENFSFEILEECPPEKLNEREVYWVAYYNSYHNGLNSNAGGCGRIYDNKEIYNLWDAGLSVGKIAEQLDCSPTTVRNQLAGYDTYSVSESKKRGGNNAFLTAKLNNHVSSNNNHSVYQFSLQGKLIASFPSMKEAQRQTNIDANSIRKVINGERNSAGGFYWSRTEQLQKMPKISSGISQSVSQYTLDGKYLTTYPSFTDAAKAVGKTDTSLIRRVCKDFSKSAYGFRWKKEE